MTTHPSTPAGPLRVVTVDDEPLARDCIRLALAREPGWAIVAECPGGRAAAEAIEREAPDLVFLDVQMPGMDGFETAKLIRERERTRYTPIIFLTAYDRSEAAVAKGYGVGAVDFLFKPLVPEVLRAKVAAFIELYRKTEEVKRQAEQLRRAEQREMEQQLAAERQRWDSDRLRREMERER